MYDMSLSFDDCPNGCVDGWYVDPYAHKRKICPHCAGRRGEIVRDASSGVTEMLNLPRSVAIGDTYDPDSLCIKSELERMDASSVEEVLGYLHTLYVDATAGTAPDTSMLFNLGKKVIWQNFISPYMLRAWRAGLKVSPCISEYDIVQLYSNVDGYMGGIKYQDLFDTDICVVLIGAGAGRREIGCVKGLMGHRAHFGRNTLIFTDAWGSLMYDLCTDGAVYASNLAYMASIKYLDSDKDGTDVKTAASNVRSSVSERVGGTMSGSEFASFIGRHA